MPVSAFRLREVFAQAIAFVFLGLIALPLAAAPGVAPKNAKSFASRASGGEAMATHSSDMSASGRLAKLAASGELAKAIERARLRNVAGSLAKAKPMVHEDEDGEGPAGGQAEYAIAVDVTGNHVVVGFNDTRGFSLPQTSLSGFAYSDDGGNTWTDGGQLSPSSNAALNGTSGATALPQVWGDPDVKYVPGGGGCQFIYSSIMNVGLGTAPGFTGIAQAMSIHRSTDCGHTWTGPYAVTPAINPAGTTTGGNADDAADKEFIDVDPDTGRVLMSWTNFAGSGAQEISTTYSDNIMSATPPTWSSRVVLNPGATDYDQGSMPRFAGNGSTNAYVVWSRSSATNVTAYAGWSYGNIMFSRSTDNGATWSVPYALLGSDFPPADQVLGGDRIHSFPSMAVDTSGGVYNGRVYVVYAGNANNDGGDVSVQISTNGGVSFPSPISLSVRPGSDGSQWFPYVTVGSNGRVSVIFYDQQARSTGDLTETMWSYSDNGGVSFTEPAPLTDRPFHAGYGNDTGQPNIGDYIGATTNGTNLYAVWAGNPAVVNFDDGQPATQMTVPDQYFKKTNTKRIALQPGTLAFTDSNGDGYIDAGESVNITIPLYHYVTNGAFAPATYSGVSATLSTSTPGVTVSFATVAYPNIAPGATASNSTAFVIQLSSSFQPGTQIDLSLAVTTAQGTTTLLVPLRTGRQVSTTLLSEDFNGVAPGSLPAGWSAAHGGGSPTVAWTTSNTFCSTSSNGLYHINSPTGVRWERAISPNIVVPSSSDYVTVEFDICYDLEDDPDFNKLAYDGVFLRITDQTGGHTVRSVLAEAFADDITTGTAFHYPKHLPRWSNTSYFQDMSAWSGSSSGFKHVSMRLPGMAGETFQLRFEFTQDSGDCTAVRPSSPGCGVIIDNIVVKNFTTQPDLVVTKTGPTVAMRGTNVTYTVTVANDTTGTTALSTVAMNDPLPAPLTFVSLLSPGGWSCITPAVGTNGTISCSKASVAAGETGTFSIVAAVPSSTAVGTNLVNTATGTTVTTQATTANDSASVTTVVDAMPDLVVTKTGPATAFAGNNLSYTITLSNTTAGTQPANTVALSDALPAGETFVSLASPGGWACTTPAVGANGSINCSKASMAASELASFTLVAHIPSSIASGTVYSNTASASTSSTESNVGNNSATAVTTVATSADLIVSQTVSGAAIPGGTLTFTITVRNGGPSDAAAVSLNEVVSGASFVSADGACVGGFPCSLGTIVAGATVIIHANYLIPSSASNGVITATASVTSTTTDPVPANNTAAAAAAMVTSVPTLGGLALALLALLLLTSGFALQRRNARR